MTEAESSFKDGDTQTNAVADAKKFLKNYDGPVSYRPLQLTCSVLRRIYNRDAQIVQRNAVYITFFARLEFDAAVIDPIEKQITELIKKSEKTLIKAIAQTEAIIENEGIDKKTGSTITENFSVPVTSPLFGAFIALMAKGELLSINYNTLWMEGIMTGKDYQEKRYELKLEFKRIANQLRTTWVKLLKLLPEARSDRLKRATAKESKSRKKNISSDVAVASGDAISDSEPASDLSQAESFENDISHLQQSDAAENQPESLIA